MSTVAAPSLGAQSEVGTLRTVLVHRPDLVPRQNDAHAELEAVFRARSMPEWLELFEGEDVAVGPVATLLEASRELHRPETGAEPPRLGQHTDAWRAALGLESSD